MLQADEAQAGAARGDGLRRRAAAADRAVPVDLRDRRRPWPATTRSRPWRRTCGAWPRSTRRSPNCTEIGRSVEGRPLWALRIGERRGSSRTVAFLGCHHAREWISVEIPYLLAEHLLDNSSTEPVQRWLQQGEVWVAPMVNPDGHEHTRTENRLWRKNRRRNPGGSIGVDPNRNYGYMWGMLDISTSSHVPSDETYVGPRAFSEPEVRAVRNLVARQLFDGVLSYHSYSQLVLFPWGYTSEPIEDEADHAEMRTLAETMERLIRGVHGETYTAQQASKLYPTAGTPPTGPTASSTSRRSRSSCGRPPRWRAVSPAGGADPALLGGESSCRARVHPARARAAGGSEN